jgi:hypothetical protein
MTDREAADCIRDVGRLIGPERPGAASILLTVGGAIMGGEELLAQLSEIVARWRNDVAIPTELARMAFKDEGEIS